MKFRRISRKDVSIDLTPLIDVVFLLLIFFMVSTSFVKDTELSIRLPKAIGKIREANNPLEIYVNEFGNIAINGQQLINTHLKTVKSGLIKLTQNNSDQSLVILADEKAPYQSVITIMDAAGQLGLHNLKMGTRFNGD